MSDLTLPFRGGMDHPPSNDPVFKIVAGDAHIAVQGLSAGLETAQIDSIGVLGVSNPAGPAPGVPMISNGVGVKGICEPINVPGPGGLPVPVNPRQSIGVLGESSRGIGIFGRGGAFAGFFEGNVNVTGRLDHGGDFNCAGNINVQKDILLVNADCAEDFDVATAETIEPGTVMALDEEGALKQSDKAYDKRVAGVISGAGGYKPGIILDKQKSQNNRAPVGLLGKVYCKVDARYSPVEVGDLLTTSPTMGYAMKADDPFKAFGAVIGKALRSLKDGKGLIPILIALQ